MTPTDHQPYVNTVARLLAVAGLPVVSLTTAYGPHRAATIRAEIADATVSLAWDEHDGWAYTSSDYDGEGGCESLDGVHIVDPPALVVAALLRECWTARQMLRDEVPDDEESALAAYAPAVPERDASEVMSADEEQQLADVLDDLAHADRVADNVGNAGIPVEFSPTDWAVRTCGGEHECVQLLAYGHLGTGLPQADGMQGAALHLSRSEAADVAAALAKESSR